ncbi:MAG: histidine kinase [Eubacteriales bacterium]|nr:histidine kinase [Eubacteriales bacterium]
MMKSIRSKQSYNKAAGRSSVRRPVLSLQWLLVGIVLLCWVVPFAVVLGYSGYTMANNVQSRIENTIDNSAKVAFEQAYDRLEQAMDSSRAPTYDGAIRSAWKQFLGSGDEIKLYDTMSAYLSQKYSYDDSFRTTYAFFPDYPDTVYYANHHTNSAAVAALRYYMDNVHADVLDIYDKIDTSISFFKVDERLYMVRSIIDMRNLVSDSLEPYAVIVMECDTSSLFESIRGVIWLTDALVSINGEEIVLTGDADIATRADSLMPLQDEASGRYLQRLGRSEYNFNFELKIASDITDLVSQFPDYRNIMLLFAALAIPLLLLSLIAFYRHVTVPADRLVDATARIESGQRGYTVAELPANKEFYCLTEQFNSMSVQLDHQFRRIYEEQLALQEARIKALRSQINPHFLNNTLEIINWEARLADNKKVSEMIDALAVMLGAATARSDSAVVSLREELNYVDAYLHIIKQRFGRRLVISKEINSSLLDMAVPSLILQPIVENAIEHGVSKMHQGELIIRAYRLETEADSLVLEVENDGHMSAEDKNNVDRLLRSAAEVNSNNDRNLQDPSAGGSSVGIRNVNQRLKIMYGEDSGLEIYELRPNRILAKIKIPL